MEKDQALSDSEKVIHLSEIFGVTAGYLLKGKETDSVDIKRQFVKRKELIEIQ